MNVNPWLVRFGIFASGVSAIAYVLFTPMPRLPATIADGIYRNPCCNSLRLSNGRISAGTNADDYVIEHDKSGAYVLPRHYVGVSHGHSIEFVPAERALELRLDDERRPSRIEILDGDGVIYPFVLVSSRGS